MEVLGIDVGGSGIKAAIVDTAKGKVIGRRHRIPTPKPSKPDKVADVIKEMLQTFHWSGDVGLAFPTVVAGGNSLTKGNIHKKWRGFPIEVYLKQMTGQNFYAINDADAAGIAEMKFGAGVGRDGLVMVVTVGTGLGSGVFYNGVLIPNFELGRIFGKDGRPIEFYAADSARKKEGLSYKKWSKRFNFYLEHMVRIFRPDLFIIGGGASKKLHKFQKRLTVDVPIIAAKKQNNAGIIGAAMYAMGSVR